MKIVSIVFAEVALSMMVALGPASVVRGHGYLSSPRSRNWYAHLDGVSYGSVSGFPPAEYCPHCLNTNAGVCGKSNEHDYDVWNDSAGNPMPWVVQATYAAGDVVRIETVLTAHHKGHMEIRGCPLGRDSTWECFEEPGHALLFVRDVAFDMPADPMYPERGYYHGSQSTEYGVDFDYYDMEYKIPETLHGTTVLLQWRYITANSCSPPGYDAYFGGANSRNAPLPDSFWSPGLSVCQLPYPRDGSRSGVWPEQFFNCAEVIITGPGSGATATNTAVPAISTPVPAVSTPVPVPAAATTAVPGPDASPTGCCSINFKDCIDWCGEGEDACFGCSSADVRAWLPNGAVTDDCAPRWGDCYADAGSCCEGLTCVSKGPYVSACEPPPVDDGGDAATDPDPVDDATTPDPPAAGDDVGCCSFDFRGCIAWCGTTESTCGSCDESDHYSWLADGALAAGGCLARWEGCADDDPSSSCCPGLRCVQQNPWYSQCLP